MKHAATCFAVLVALGAPLAAQESAPQVRTAVLVERYTFDRGLGFDDVFEITVPVGVSIPLGRYLDLALSSGYANVRVTPSPTALDPNPDDLVVSGALDSEARLSFHPVPGNLVVFVNGAVPTGVETVRQSEVSVLTLLASDLIGFSTSTLGTGGTVGGGFAGAIPLGSWALGIAATFREPLSFEPVVGQPEDLKPGREVRLRTGLEGPLGGRSYLRAAGIFALRAKDEVGGITRNGVGNRVMGYLSFDQGVGNAALTVYAFDVFRSDPRIEETAVGAAILPRSNLIAAGARLTVRLGQRTSVVPRGEFRNSWVAADQTDTQLRKAGRSFRFGTDIRHMVHQRVALVLQGEGTTGFVRQQGQDFDFRGFRTGLHVEVTP